MAHLKRQKTPKNWPIPRKGTTYVVRPKADLNNGIPILLAVRDLLKLAKNRKEVKKVLREGKILLNGQNVREEKNSLTLFDILNIVPMKKNYQLSLSKNGKFSMEETNEVSKKVVKIVDKKILKGKKIQFNFSDGRNLLSKENYGVNDSVVIDVKEKRIDKHLPFKDKMSAIVIGGKHAGLKGTINEIKEGLVVVEDQEKNKANILIKHIMVTENGK